MSSRRAIENFAIGLLVIAILSQCLSFLTFQNGRTLDIPPQSNSEHLTEDHEQELHEANSGLGHSYHDGDIQAIIKRQNIRFNSNKKRIDKHSIHHNRNSTPISDQDNNMKEHPNINKSDNYVYMFGNQRGKDFHPDRLIRELIEESAPTNDVALTVNFLNDFVIVTGSSYDHFNESIDAVAAAQTRFPTKQIFYYDLGLSKEQITQVKNMCRVTYRVINWDLYPNHVRNLQTYAFKPVIIREMLREYTGVFWIDSSVRFLTDKLLPSVSVLQQNGGILLFSPTSHSNFAVTRTTMYKYLPTDFEQQKTTEQIEANSILVYNTKTIYQKVLKWWYLCALREDCIANILTSYLCYFKNGRWKEFAGCHRYDQSALNILLANVFHFDVKLYKSNSEVLRIFRFHSNMYNLAVYPHC